MGLSPSERSRGLGHINIQKGLGSVEAVSLQTLLFQYIETWVKKTYAQKY